MPLALVNNTGMRHRSLISIVAPLVALVILSGCIEPVELTKLRRVHESRVLVGAASAEQFWIRADAIAQAYKAPASERARLAEMIEIGRRADWGHISLGAYRVHHDSAIARYEAQRKHARRMAARMWSRVFSSRAAHPQSRPAPAVEQKAWGGQTTTAGRALSP